MNSVNYNGYRLSFRGDLREANKIAVYPSDNDVYNLMTNPNLRNITIVFQNTTAGLDSVAVESFEITYKLRTAYLISGMDVGFSSQKTNNLRNVTSSQENIAIVLIPPSIANETAVRVDNNTVTISGKTQREFDLATIKFLMVSLGIKI